MNQRRILVLIPAVALTMAAAVLLATYGRNGDVAESATLTTDTAVAEPVETTETTVAATELPVEEQPDTDRSVNPVYWLLLLVMLLVAVETNVV